MLSTCSSSEKEVGRGRGDLVGDWEGSGYGCSIAASICCNSNATKSKEDKGGDRAEQETAKTKTNS